jgi:hypothetical protein
VVDLLCTEPFGVFDKLGPEALSGALESLGTRLGLKGARELWAKCNPAEIFLHFKVRVQWCSPSLEDPDSPPGPPYGPSPPVMSGVYDKWLLYAERVMQNKS